MAFSTDDLEALRRDLAQLPPSRPKSVSNRDAVGALTSELAAAQRLGYSVDDLAQLLSSKGLRMTAGTLKGYLQQARKKKRPNKKSATTGNPGAETTATAGTTAAPATTASQPTSASSVACPDRRVEPSDARWEALSQFAYHQRSDIGARRPSARTGETTAQRRFSDGITSLAVAVDSRRGAWFRAPRHVGRGRGCRVPRRCVHGAVRHWCLRPLPRMWKRPHHVRAAEQGG